MGNRVVLPMHAADHHPGGPDPIPSLALWPVKVFRDDIPVATTPPFTYKVPQDLGGHTLVRVEGFVTTSGGSDTEVQLVKNPAGAADEMLSTVLTIPSGDLNDDEGAVIDPDFAEVAYGDHIQVLVATAGSGATGLGVYMYFLTGPDAINTITGPQGPQGDTGPAGPEGDPGPQGDPGGVVAWTGGWDSGTTYSADDAVSHMGSSYVAITGSTDVEPGVDAGWESSWMLLAEGAAVSLPIDATDVDITDTGGYFTSTDVEGALQELGAGGGGGGLFNAYALLRHTLSQSTDGGASTSGSWQTRPLNTEVFDTDGIVSLSSNDFTLDDGAYALDGWSSTYQSNARSQCRIYNVTDAAAETNLYGSSEYSPGGSAAMVKSVLKGILVVTGGPKAYRMQYAVQASQSGDGLGTNANLGPEIYAELQIMRLASA